MRGNPIPVRSTPDLVYREVGGVRLHIDLHRPDTDDRVPVVVYTHGGGWAVGDRADQLTSRLIPLAQRGIAVAAVQYRLSGAEKFPAQLLDARAAVEWVRAHGAEYGLLTDRIGAWGSSAGGHLAALLGLESPLGADGSPGSELFPPVAAAISPWNAVLDLDGSFARSWLEEEETPVGASEPAALLGSTTFDPVRPTHRAANPIALVTPGASPMYFVTGDRDSMVNASDSYRMHDALVRDRVASTLTIVGGAGHEDVRLDEEPQLDSLAAFFRAHLTG